MSTVPSMLFNLLVQCLPTKANVRVELTASVEDDKPYNSTTVFLFDLNHK